MKTYRLVGIAIALLSLTAVPTFAADNGKEFIKDSIRGNLAEQRVGELAQTRGHSEAVRAFGASLKNDHGLANQRAMAAATLIGVAPPTQSSLLQTVGYRTLSTLSGAEFDKKFIKDMLEDHNEEVKLYEQQLDSSYPAVATYAKKILPDLKKHLETAQQLQSLMMSSN